MHPDLKFNKIKNLLIKLIDDYEINVSHIGKNLAFFTENVEELKAEALSEYIKNNDLSISKTKELRKRLDFHLSTAFLTQLSDDEETYIELITSDLYSYITFSMEMVVMAFRLLEKVSKNKILELKNDRRSFESLKKIVNKMVQGDSLTEAESFAIFSNYKTIEKNIGSIINNLKEHYSEEFRINLFKFKVNDDFFKYVTTNSVNDENYDVSFDEHLTNIATIYKNLIDKNLISCISDYYISKDTKTSHISNDERSSEFLQTLLVANH
ncbi:MAG: hypothetical protein J0H68_04955 [Sphingobacteriia bacterium]|nr:hypothetical protein [Sphingobacteriia bacterium]